MKRKHFTTIELSTPYRAELGPTSEHSGVYTTPVYVVLGEEAPGHPKDADLRQLISDVTVAVHKLAIAVANKQTYKVGDAPTLAYTDSEVAALQYHCGRLERIGA